MDKKILKEIEQYRRYMKHMGFLVEQEEDVDDNIDDLNLDPVGDDNMTTSTDTTDMPSDDMPSDDVPSDDMPSDDVEEVDVSDIIIGQENLENKFNDTEKKIVDTTTKVDTMFTKLDDLDAKIAELNTLYDAINDLSVKIDDSRPKKPEEKLELRSLDSYPFNQKLTDYFRDKQPEMELTGKNDYVLTTDDIEGSQTPDIAKSFVPPTRN